MPRTAGRSAHDQTARAREIGARFKQARIATGMSQRQIAAETPMTAAYISRIEAGARTPTLDALRVFARALGVTVEWLETGRDEVTITLSRPTAERLLEVTTMRRECVPEPELAAALMAALHVEDETVRGLS